MTRATKLERVDDRLLGKVQGGAGEPGGKKGGGGRVPFVIILPLGVIPGVPPKAGQSPQGGSERGGTGTGKGED